jgi:phosphopantetheine adenylyltransferase
MAIEFEFTRVQPVIDPDTNTVTHWVIGLTATEGELSAYKDEQAEVPSDQLKSLDQWSDEEIKEFITEYAQCEIKDEEGNVIKQDWFKLLTNRIEAQKKALKMKPSRAKDWKAVKDSKTKKYYIP